MPTTRPPSERSRSSPGEEQAVRLGVPLLVRAPDYPAAHSMDTSWYAVDPAGHVAVFESGENGHAPNAAGEGAFYLNDLFRARNPTVPDWDYREPEALAEEFGFFLYAYGESFDPIDVYERRVVPPRPAHVDQLPPEVRDGCKRFRLPVAFAAAERVQPLDFFECACWSEEDRAGYVSADGVTVRARPGKEGQFAESVRRFREEYPEAAARYRFEGVDEGP
jgi:hypothetical protein